MNRINTVYTHEILGLVEFGDHALALQAKVNVDLDFLYYSIVLMEHPINDDTDWVNMGEFHAGERDPPRWQCITDAWRAYNECVRNLLYDEVAISTNTP